jgi:dTDP-4-amino-4,6-dideoxygalactose transaminase
MSNYRIYLSPPSQNGFEQEALLDCLCSNWLAPVGPHVDLFEKSLSKIHNDKKIVALNSGTAAIHLALRLCNVEKGDEVIVGTHTHNATVNPIIYQNAVPVFVDSEIGSWNISPKFLREAIDARLKLGKKPKAIIIVHLYGMAAELEEILSISKQYQIPLIEDAAEALGSTYNGKALGTFGNYGILSFNGNKIITTSGGGALICSTQIEKDRVIFLATQARDKAAHFEHSEIGYNYRLSNVLAALGNAQLKNLSERVEKRRAIHAFYQEAFGTLNKRLESDMIKSTPEKKGVYSNRWLSSFLVKEHQNITSSTWRKALELARIESRPLWKPMHLQPIFKSFPFYGDHTSDCIFEQGICLPSGNDLTTDQLLEITGIISSLYD